MALTVNIAPTFLVYPAGLDPRLPTGVWFASQSEAGDASGGDHNMNIQLMTANAFGGSGRTVLFDLSELSVAKEDGSAPDGGLVTINMAVNPLSLASGVNQFRSFQTLSDGSNSRLVQRDVQLPFILGYPADGAIGTLRVVLPNDTGVTDAVQASGSFWLAESVHLPGGESDNPANIQDVQPPAYPVGQDAFYSKLRSGEPMDPQTNRIIETIKAPVRAQASVRSTDQELVDQVVREVGITGVPIRTAINRVIGLSPDQVVSQLESLRPGQTPAPGARYANLTGRFNEYD